MSAPAVQTFPEAALVPEARSLPTTFTAPSEPARQSLALHVATASITLHLLLISWSGAGVPQARRRPAIALEKLPPAVVENVAVTVPLDLAPPPPLESRAPVPAPDAPAAAANLDLPPLPTVQSVAAVSTAAPVAFGIGVNGPVRLVANAAGASGVIGGRRLTKPVVLDSSNEQNLVLPTLSYPPRARSRHLTGTVVLEFQTNAAGDILGVRVRTSSGHEILDQAAKENLEHGRWKGRPGAYLKAFEFTLQ